MANTLKNAAALDRRIHELRDAVCDEPTFLDFLEALSKDWTLSHADPSGARHLAPWECGSVGEFLQRITTAGNDSWVSGKRFEQVPNDWHRIACLIYLGKRYD